MKQLLTPYFWLSLRGDLATFSRYALIGLIVILFVSLVYAKLTEKKWKKTLWRKVQEKTIGFLFTNLLIGSYLFFVTSQLVPVLSARIWFLFWGAGMALWSYFIYQEYRLIPEKKQKIEQQKEIKKYIP